MKIINSYSRVNLLKPLLNISTHCSSSQFPSSKLYQTSFQLGEGLISEICAIPYSKEDVFRFSYLQSRFKYV